MIFVSHDKPPVNEHKISNQNLHTSQIDYILSYNDTFFYQPIYTVRIQLTLTCTKSMNKSVSRKKNNTVVYKLIEDEMNKNIYINEIDKRIHELFD